MICWVCPVKFSNQLVHYHALEKQKRKCNSKYGALGILLMEENEINVLMLDFDIAHKAG